VFSAFGGGLGGLWDSSFLGVRRLMCGRPLDRLGDAGNPLGWARCPGTWSWRTPPTPLYSLPVDTDWNLGRPSLNISAMGGPFP